MRKTKSVMVITSINGQIFSATIIKSGSGSALSAVLIIMKARDAPQDNKIIELTKEKIWVLLILPVLRTMNTWVKQGSSLPLQSRAS